MFKWDLSFIYVSFEGRVGCEFIHPAQPTDGPSSRRSSRSHFYTVWLTPFRGLVPLGRRYLVPILPPASGNISAISWRPVLVVEEAGVPGENHRP